MTCATSLLKARLSSLVVVSMITETNSRAARLLTANWRSSDLRCNRRPASEEDEAWTSADDDRVKVMPATVGDKSSAAINHTLGKFGLFIFGIRTFLAVPAAREGSKPA